ncbi:MAG TPA: hypothetical protein VFO10_28530 [Oligoflexus sp.]|uniref:hypothetical protein n=1 Tax=Oligoflexus sp. TaxID=1971216 RepID=UPI002D7EAAE5|nr:hypothetical protein [Oligoflexus sp.]HET9241245.1 hypothetical protein [Oligoflexus sp.]
MLSTWNKALIFALALVPWALEAQEPGRAEGSWQHANGVWLGWQRSGSAEADHGFYLVDNGAVTLNRSVPARNQLTRLGWTLGLGERLDRFVIVDGQTIWERTVGLHRFSLGLTVGGSVFYGSTRFANLEDQFILSNGLDTGRGGGTTDRWGAGVNIADTISLSKTVDLTLDASRQESRLRLPDTDPTESTIDSWGARLEKRWVIAQFQGSVRKTELDLGDNGNVLELRTKQSVLDSQARLLFPLVGRLNGSVGWQDLRSQGSNADDRQLSGPELGLAYTPLSSWRASIFARALREKGNENSEGQVFGEADLAFRGDARNSFLLSLSKQIDLTTSYRVFTVQNFVTTDQQQDTVTGTAQWSHQRGRYSLILNLTQSRQQFEQSEADFTEMNLTQTFDVTRRAQLSIVLGGRRNLFETDTPPVSIKRNFADLRIGWQEILTGGLRPLGGRLFYRLDTSYENLDEEITDVTAERLTFLVSLGQLGNF